jgi:hypothetical protein
MSHRMGATHPKDTLRARCTETDEEFGQCEFEGTLAALELHEHTWIDQDMYPGGRCEDYPCCGHTDGDGCRPLPSHTSDFYYRNPHLLHEPGSPEYEDALDDMSRGDLDD